RCRAVHLSTSALPLERRLPADSTSPSARPQGFAGSMVRLGLEHTDQPTPTSRHRPACFRAVRSHFRQQRDGILDAVGDEGEELTRLGAVAGTVVEDEAQVHDLADGELTVDDPRTLLD